VSRYALGNIVIAERRCEETLCMGKESCGCVIRTLYELQCACIIAMKIRDNKPIRLDEIHRRWHRLCMSEEKKMKMVFL
jgi:hypothetical protein